MRRLPAVLAFLPLLVLPVHSPALGQEGAKRPEDGAESGTSSPQKRVTELIRQAMEGPGRREVWAGLALSLSEMNREAREEGRETAGMEEAVRIADSLAFSSLPPEAATAGAEPGRDPGSSWNARSLTELEVGDLGRTLFSHPMALPGVLGLILLVLLFLRSRESRGRATKEARLARGPRGRVDPESPMTSEPRETGNSGGQDPWAFALALWESGLPASEVARRTGLAQDTLAVLLTLQDSRGPTPHSNPRTRRA
jgi:hypothetical protein